MGRDAAQRWDEHPDFGAIKDLAGCRAALDAIGKAEAEFLISPDQAGGLRETTGAIMRSIMAPDGLEDIVIALKEAIKKPEVSPAGVARLANVLLRYTKAVGKVVK